MKNQMLLSHCIIKVSEQKHRIPPLKNRKTAHLLVPPRRTARRVYIETYGCQMNVSDSELIAGILTQSGHQTVSHVDDADVVLVNTCAIRENAETKVINRLQQLNHRKRRHPELIIGVCGCMAQHLRDRLLEVAPYVDMVMGPGCVSKLADGTERGDKSRPVSGVTTGQKRGLRRYRLHPKRGHSRMANYSERVR